MRATRSTFFVLILLSAGFCLSGRASAQEKKVLQASKAAQENKAEAEAEGASFGYKFENKRFYIPLIEIDLASNGTGELRFTRGESDEVIDRKLKLLPATVSRIRELYERIHFLTSDK